MMPNLLKKRAEQNIQVFISYRRESGADLARLVWETLNRRGFVAFMDVEDLRSGPFNTSLYSRIAEASDFVVILTPNALDRCQNEGDWLGLELAYAFQNKKNVIPVIARGFHWPESGQLPADLVKLPSQQGVAHSHELFRGSMDKLEQLLSARPRRRIGYPVVGAVLALLLVSLWFLVRDHKPNGTDPVTPSDNRRNDAILDQYIKTKTAAAAAWERVNSIDRGNGFGVLMDQVHQQQRVAAEYDMRKADAQALVAYQLLTEMCSNIEAKQQVRVQVQEARRDAEDLMRSTDSAFKGSNRPPSFVRGRRSLADADSLLAAGKFEPATIQLSNATSQFVRAQTDSLMFNVVLEAQESWNTALAAVDRDLLDKYARAQFQAARSKGTEAQSEVLAGQIEAATTLFKQATVTLKGALQFAQDGANKAIAEAQMSWAKALANANVDLLIKHAAEPFNAAKAIAADAQAKASGGQAEVAVLKFTLATVALSEAIGVAERNAKNLLALSANTNVIVPAQSVATRPDADVYHSQTNRVPGLIPGSATNLIIAPAVTPQSQTARDQRSYLSDTELTSRAIPSARHFLPTVNRFTAVANGEVMDTVLNKTWVLCPPESIMIWNEACAIAKNANARIPTLAEISTLVTSDKKSNEWGYVNGSFFPESRRSSQYWTSDRSGMFLLHRAADLKERITFDHSADDACALLLIRD